MDLGLQGKVVLVTGAGRGIGRVTALMFAAEGARVGILDLDGEQAAVVEREVQAQGGQAVGFACDVTDASQVELAVARVVQALGPIGILVNNAGISRDRTLLKMPEDDWDLVLNVNLKGMFHCCRAVLPGMKQNRWGRVINLSSRSMFGNPGQTAYSASKLGVVGFTRSLSLEQARNGITVNAVAPGFVETEGMQALPTYPSLKETATGKNPVGFLGEPKDIAAPVLFLASDQARYITGTTMFVTGGRFSS
jgi:3-oxoacyl-[acyl-carrier protein] reductase